MNIVDQLIGNPKGYTNPVTLQSGRFTITASFYSVYPYHDAVGADNLRRLVGEGAVLYTDALILERLPSGLTLYVSLSKDTRFGKFKPNANVDKVEYNSFVERNGQSHPLWLMCSSKLDSLIEFCKGIA